MSGVYHSPQEMPLKAVDSRYSPMPFPQCGWESCCIAARESFYCHAGHESGFCDLFFRFWKVFICNDSGSRTNCSSHHPRVKPDVLLSFFGCLIKEIVVGTAFVSDEGT